MHHTVTEAIAHYHDINRTDTSMTYRLTFRRRLLLFIVLPTAIVAFYYGIWASNMFVSEAHFSLRPQRETAVRSCRLYSGKPP